MNKSVPPLEQRIAAALNATDITSDAVAALIAEAEAAAQAADAEAIKTREDALDPAVVVDAAKVGAAVATAELVRDRLQAALPKLRERYTEARQREDAAAWNITAEKLRARREEKVAELVRIFPVELIKKIVAQLTSMEALDRQISAHNYRLYELQLRKGGDACHSIPSSLPAFAAELKIPDMEKPPGTFLWPPPPDYAAALSMIRPDPFCGEYVRDGTYARLEDERRRAAEERELEDAKQRERAFTTGGR